MNYDNSKDRMGGIVMNTDLHKRFEEASDNFIGHPYEIEEGIDITDKRTAFNAGAELGYKEAIAQAKEWILNNVHKYEGINGTIFHQSMVADFESYMNKLLE